jgi:hypothetical protein
MDGATYQATVVNGQIQLLSPTTLPENATVYVIVPTETSVPRIRTPRVVDVEDLAGFELTIKDVADAGL